MALISIPSSISGVTIPGGLISGPLGALFSNPFGQNNLQYPRDLQSATKGHVVHFTIKEVQPIKYDEIQNFAANGIEKIKETAREAASAVTSGSFTLNNKLVTLTENIFNRASAAGNDLLGSTRLSFQPRREKIAGNVFLYMPDTMNFQYDVSYDDSVSVLGAAGKFIEKIFSKAKGGNAVTSLISAGVSSQAAALIGQKAGFAVNPQLQMLFQGIGFRQYQMAFTFTPYSRQEARQVENIIKLIRAHAAPRIVSGTAGMFFIPPSSFTLKFLYNGSENKRISKVTESVITNIDVNYSPNGWAAFDDGAPVQTTMVLQFKEIDLIDRDKIEKQGY